MLWGLVAAACSLQASAAAPRDYNTYDYYALHLDSDTSPGDIASHLGLQHEGQLASLDDHHVFRVLKEDQDRVQDAREELRRRRLAKRDLTPNILDGILLNQKQQPRNRLFKRSVPPSLPGRETRAQQSTAAVDELNMVAKSLSIQDPTFSGQWHLFNTEQVGHDLNVTGVWLQGITGTNSTVCIIDDGLDMDSLDLADNYFPAGSHDFNDGVDEPRPRLADDTHGTRCAGEVAAVRNDVCGVGVAYDAKVSGVRILSAPISDIEEAESMMYGYQAGNDIFSCSWGPPDDGHTMEAPGILVKRAITRAVQQGRHGLGTVYVFAAGNGAANGDNCNFDGYTNSIDSITVGAIDRNDHHPYYSEACSAQLVVTYSSGAGDGIHTTDVGRDKCTTNHGGTSAAGPLAAGVYALVLSARPDLTWRDLQWLTVMTAVPIDADPNDWQVTATGRKFSHQYGYGKLDTYAIVETAKTWKNVNAQAWYISPSIQVNHPITQGELGLASTFEVTADMLKTANVIRLEHVTVTMNVTHGRRGDLSVELKSPFGVTSHLAVTRPHDEATTGYPDWTFMSVAHFNESGVGKWSVIVKDTNQNEKTGTFVSWRLKLFGEAIDGTNQPLLPLPGDPTDVDDAKVTDIPSITSITMPTSISTVDGSGHPTRPAIAKPTADKGDDAGQAPGTGDNDAGNADDGKPESGTDHGDGSQVGGGGDGTLDNGDASPETGSDDQPGAGGGASGDGSGESIIPSFPTFGVSKRTQIWIYAAIGLILVFCIGLLCWLLRARRRLQRNRTARDEYTFEMVGDDDDDDDAPANGTVRRKRGRRAGELYDAFAGESDEESLLSEDEEDGHAHGPYHDRQEGYRDRDEKGEDDYTGGGGEQGVR